MTNIQLINALRARSLFNVKVLDVYVENNCVQVRFEDKEGTWVLTDPIEGHELVEKAPEHRRRMMARAYAL